MAMPAMPKVGFICRSTCEHTQHQHLFPDTPALVLSLKKNLINLAGYANPMASTPQIFHTG